MCMSFLSIHKTQGKQPIALQTSPTRCSSMNQNGVTIRLSEETNDFKICTKYVEHFCEQNNLSPKLVFKITLVLDELISNIISYGYNMPEEHVIDVHLEMDEAILTMVVEDGGAPFNPLEAEEPELNIPLDERKRQIGGMGIHLVRSITDSQAYERKDDKNILTMTMNVAKCIQEN